MAAGTHRAAPWRGGLRQGLNEEKFDVEQARLYFWFVARQCRLRTITNVSLSIIDARMGEIQGVLRIRTEFMILTCNSILPTTYLGKHLHIHGLSGIVSYYATHWY